MYNKIEFSLSAAESEFRNIVGDTVRSRSHVFERSDRVFYAGDNPISFDFYFDRPRIVGTTFASTDQEIDGVRTRVEGLLGRKAEDFEYHATI